MEELEQKQKKSRSVMSSFQKKESHSNKVSSLIAPDVKDDLLSPMS